MRNLTMKWHAKIDVNAVARCLAILAIPTTKSSLVYRSLGRSPFGWVCATSLLISIDGPRAFETLLREELLWIASENSAFHHAACKELIRRGASMSNLCTTDKGLLEFALASAGVVLIPDAMSAPHLETKQLTRLDDALPMHDLELFVATKKGQRQTAISRFEEILLRSRYDNTQSDN